MKAWQLFLKNISSLFEVKSIVTITILLVFCYKTLVDTPVTSEFVMIASAIVTYYFAKPESKKERLNYPEKERLNYPDKEAGEEE